ncbi:MAG: hypothetical protein IT324_04690 [Anaerolineae bacterium]|nr:hypothetical protein [Anaerolineae bacterium]
MGKLSQVGIAVAVLGGVVALIGLFPSITGLEQASGVGVLQTLVVLAGFSILIGGAFLFVQSTYYAGVKHNLAQQIALRLSMTGLVISTASGLADVLGFGSHPSLGDQRPFMGTLQTVGLIGGFVVASIGVIIFALMGEPTPDDDNPDKTPLPL